MVRIDEPTAQKFVQSLENIRRVFSSMLMTEDDDRLSVEDASALSSLILTLSKSNASR